MFYERQQKEKFPFMPTQQTQDRVQWQNHMNILMNFWVPEWQGIFK